MAKLNRDNIIEYIGEDSDIARLTKLTIQSKGITDIESNAFQFPWKCIKSIILSKN